MRVFVKRCIVLLVAVLFVHPLGAQEANNGLVEMILEFVADDDKDIRGLAFEQIRSEVKGTPATERFAAELPALSPAAQVGLLAALADRGDVAAKPAVRKLLSSNHSSTVVAAIRALGKLGDASDVQTFLPLLKSNDPSHAAAARIGLTQLKGENVSAAIAENLKTSADALSVTLIEILATRRAVNTVPQLLELAQGDVPTIRVAAMKALGEIGGPREIPGMAQAILKAPKGNERNSAEKCLMFVCHRIEDPDQQATPLLAAMSRLSPSKRTALIPALGRIGGEPALVEVKKAIADRNAAVHMAGIRAISNWPNASVAKELLSIAKSDRHADHQRIARMSLLRVAPLPDGRTDEQKLQLLKESMKLAANDKERNYGIKRAAAIRLVETLRFVLPFTSQAPYKDQACQTIVELAHDRSLRDGNKAEFHAALDLVIAQSMDAQLIERANRYKQGQTWVRTK